MYSVVQFRFAEQITSLQLKLELFKNNSYRAKNQELSLLMFEMSYQILMSDL